MNSKTIEHVHAQRRLSMRVWHVVMWGGEVVFFLLVIAARLPVHACILSLFALSGIWVFASDKITDIIVRGSDKQTDN